MSQVTMYVDGFNLYHAIDELERPELKWVNLYALANSYLKAGDRLVGVKYFTAVVTWDANKAARHRAYLSPFTSPTSLKCAGSVLASNGTATSEKQTDVALAVTVLQDVHAGTTDRVILVTADSDQIPLISHLTEAHRAVAVEIAAPPGRMTQARQLCSLATSFSEISPGRLRTCLLPRNVVDAEGRVVATCPLDYLPGP
jgi:uncharacterized LabA/DUF88 family protein